jgi:integrase
VAKAKRTANDYIFEHPQSRNFFVRLRDENGRRFVESLGTSDRREAEILAGPKITEHKARLLAARPRLTAIPNYAVGRHLGPNGEDIIVSPDQPHRAIFIHKNGTIEPRGNLRSHVDFGSGRVTNARFEEALSSRPTPAPKKNGDDAILETYLKHANITGQYEREARATWALFKSLCDKPLKDADRDDGRKLVAYFQTPAPRHPKGLKSATIAKKVGWLAAACNLAIKEGKLKFNPFASVVPDGNDKLRRLPLDDADMKVVKRNLKKLTSADQLLFRLLASSGMRLSEAFEIDGEMKERGVRFVVVGKKTEQSLRRVPLPAAVLPHLPKVIKGPLFVSKHADPPDMASKRLGKFLDDIGITDPRKVVHSLRHRAQDRLRAAGCPEDVRWAILGHEERTVAAGYGEGFPVPMLKQWIDKIGCDA